MQGRGSGGESTLNASCSENAGREKKTQFPQTQGLFLLRLHRNSLGVGGAAAWLWRLLIWRARLEVGRDV